MEPTYWTQKKKIVGYINHSSPSRKDLRTSLPPPTSFFIPIFLHLWIKTHSIFLYHSVFLLNTNTSITISFSTTLSFRYCICRNHNHNVATNGHPLQFVEPQLRSSSKLVSSSSHQILQQTSPILISDGLFHFFLSRLEDPTFLSHYFLLRFLSPFHLPSAISDAIFDKIASFAVQLAADNLNLDFHIIPIVNYFTRFGWTWSSKASFTKFVTGDESGTNVNDGAADER